MINYDKIQAAILNAVYKDPESKKIGAAADSHFIMITYDGASAFRIPRSDWLLNDTIIENKYNRALIDIFQHNINWIEHDDTIYTIYKKQYYMIEIDNKKMYLNKKSFDLYKSASKYEEITLSCAGFRKPVFIYVNHASCIGCMMPFIKKGE